MLSGLGIGLSTPSSNNATLELAPDQTAGVAGLRGMFRQSGAITAVSVVSAVAAGSSSPGLAQAWMFAGFAVVVIAVIPAIRLVPDHRGRW